VVEQSSMGAGQVGLDDLGECGSGCVIEAGVRIFGADYVRLGSDVYLGHDSFFRAYPEGLLEIGSACWIGPGCFINSFGGVVVGRRVGIGPGVKIITSVHQGGYPHKPIIDTPIVADSVRIADGVDIGAGAILLPGADVGNNAQVGAGAVVTGRVANNDVVAGVPAKSIKSG